MFGKFYLHILNVISIHCVFADLIAHEIINRDSDLRYTVRHVTFGNREKKTFGSANCRENLYVSIKHDGTASTSAV